MPCRVVPTNGRMGYDGPSYVTMCSRGAASRRRRCTGCRQLCDRLCDIPIAGPARGRRQATCSAPVCSTCSVRLGDDDVCPAHPVPDEALAAAAGGAR